MVKRAQISAIRCTSRPAIHVTQSDWLEPHRPSQSKTAIKTPSALDLETTPLLCAAAPHYPWNPWEDPKGGAFSVPAVPAVPLRVEPPEIRASWSDQAGTAQGKSKRDTYATKCFSLMLMADKMNG